MSKERTKLIEVPVRIPTLDGKGVAETVMVEVECTVDPTTGEELLSGQALAKLDQVKARYMGLMLPEEIRRLRQAQGLTQREMSELLQMGGKTFTRWESGLERPSRSLNLLLRSLADGKVNAAYLRSLRGPMPDWWALAASVPTYITISAKTTGGTNAPPACGEEDAECAQAA